LTSQKSKKTITRFSFSFKTCFS